MSDNSRDESQVSAEEKKASVNENRKAFALIDIVVLIVFLSTAVLGLYLFRQDLMQTLDARELESVGTIVIRQNVVQRRHEDRTIWDRLFVESPVYSGDLIRVADLSAASIFIEDNQLNVNENTIIRIQGIPGARGTFEVELQEGNLSLESGVSSAALLINLMGNLVKASQGAILNAAVSQEGMSVQVNEGTVSFIEDDPHGKGQVTRELTEGSMVAKDSKGVERAVPSAVILRPRPNARYLKHTSAPLLVTFSLQRINLSDEDKLRLDFSTDRSFQDAVISIDNISVYEQVNFDIGLWYWRIVLDTDKANPRVLNNGNITILDSSGPELLSPVTGSTIRYADTLPQLRFQWSEREGASHYILEVSRSPIFTVMQLNRQISSTSSIQSGLGEGTWYWRVKPVFSSAYEGLSEFSRVASFAVEQTVNSQAMDIEIPEPEVVAAIIAELPTPSGATVPGMPAPAWEITVTSSAVIPTITRSRGPNRTPQRRTHTVVPGDTLARIALQLYGDGSLYTRIVEANNISNPDLIYPGQVFIIP